MMSDAEILPPEPGRKKVDPRTLYCSFCGKTQHEVICLIAGPTAFICNECVELCLPLVEEHKARHAKTLIPDQSRETL